MRTRIFSVITLVYLTLLACLIPNSVVLAAEYETDADIIMIGDVHGAYPELVTILKHAGLVDADLNWSAGQTHFVSTGDLMDRGPSSRKIMDLLIKLQSQAEQQGGKLHVLLGNHEVLNMIGDWRYISDGEYQEFANEESAQMRAEYFDAFKKDRDSESTTELLESFNASFPAGFFARLEAFMPEGKYGAWLHELPFVLRVNQHLFTHGGLSVKAHGKDIADFNKMLKKELLDYTHSWSKLISDGRLAPTTDYALRIAQLLPQRQTRTIRKFIQASQGLLFTADSPNWYRGNTMCHPLFEEEVLDEALRSMGATQLWVGHTSATTVRQRFDNKLIMMDTGMLRQAYGGEPIYARIFATQPSSEQARPWEFINAATGQKIEPSTVPKRRSINPFNMSDQQLEAFLLTANVTDQKKLSEGITNPYKITLEKDGKTVYAIFKHVDMDNDNNRGATTVEPDRYQHEIVAYKLDRIMGMHVVPVSVERKINGKKGALQPWIDDLISFNEMQAKNIRYDGFCDYQHQRKMMDIFDFLISNQDRHLGNITFTENDWQLWFIDHTRAFGSSKNRPKLIKDADLTLTPAFREILQSLNSENLSVLEEWLRAREISAILKRRDLLLDGKA